MSLRGSVWDWSNPFVSTAHPSNSSNQTKNAINVLGTWSRAAGSSKVQELRVGYNNFAWENRPQPGLENTPEYRFPGLTIGKPFNFPQLFYQDNLEARYDLTWHAGRHDLKIGGEFFYISNTGTWFIQQAGVLTFLSLPSDMASRIPQDAALDPSRWNLTGLDGIAQRFDRNYHAGDWSIDVPRPTWAVWIGDTWRASDRITVNAGVRWDVDLGATDPPDVIDEHDSARQRTVLRRLRFRTGIRDLRNVAPRAGFTWNIGGDQRLVIRGGSGLYFTTPVSNVTFSPQIYSQMITATFPNDGRPGFVADPTRGVELVRAGAGGGARAVASRHQSGLPQSVHLAEQHRRPAAARRVDRRRRRSHVLPELSRARTIDPEPVLRSGHRLQPESGAAAGRTRPTA